MDDFERRVLICELRAWGRWVENHAHYHGYPSINILAAFIGGSGGGMQGHRVLCLDMPLHVFTVNVRVQRLPDREQEAIWLKYVTVLKEDGTVYSQTEKCLKLGITEYAFRKRVTRAYYRLLGLPQPDLQLSQKLDKFSLTARLSPEAA